MSYQFEFAAVLAYHAELLKGLWLTIVITCCTLALGFMVGVAAALGRMSRFRAIRLACGAYVELIRNTPLLVQLFFIYFGLPAFGVRLSPEVGAIVALTINTGAYCTEIVRAGLEATPRGHIEAGLSLAMSRIQVFRHVMLVPALQRIYPALTSQFIIIMLATSVASQITADELTAAGNFIQSRNFRSFEIFAVIGVIYLMLAIGFRQVFDFIGRRLIYRRG